MTSSGPQSDRRWFVAITLFLLTILLCGLWPVPTFAQDQGGPPSVPADWSVETVAEFPEIRYPSVVEVAPDGRVFVAEDPQDMIGPVGDPLGRIVCFHPDGRKTVVEENFHAVFGLLFVDGKLYVNHPPKVTLLNIEGGKATHRKTLIERLGKDPWQWGFNDHIPSQLKHGMDGYIYMSVGDKGIHRAKGTDGSTATLQGGGLLRFRPGATDLEVFTTGTRNHLDVALNSEDEKFVYDNDGGANVYQTRVMHLVDGGYYGYPYEVNPTPPYVLPKIESYGGGSPTGAVAYTGARLPERFHDNLFMLEWGKSAVVRFVVSRSGATYQIDQRERFFERNNGPFKPVGISQGENGISFYVTDWNFNGWTADKKRGQLFKMTYTGETRDVKIPEWYPDAGNGHSIDVSISRLIDEGLKHPAKRVRMVAQRRLADRGKKAIKPVVDLLTSTHAPEHAKWHGIWTLDAIDEARSSRDVIMDLTKPNHPESVRRQAIRQLGTRGVRESLDPLTEAIKDENASIRFQAATALGRIGDPEAVSGLKTLLDDNDRFVRFAAFTALNRIGRSNPESFHKIAEGLNSDKETIRNGTRFALRETYVVENVRALSNIVKQGSSRPARSAALRLLIPLMKKRAPWDGGWWKTSPADEKPRPRTENWNGTDIVRSTLEHVAKSDSNTLNALMLSRISSLEHNEIPTALVDTLLHLYEQPAMRGAAKNALLNARHKKALPVYLDGLTSKSKPVRKKAREALESMSSELRETVFQQVRSGSLSNEALTQLAQVYSTPEPLRNWQIVGPFKRDRQRPFDLNDGSLERTFEGKNGTVSWTKAEGNKQHGKVNLEHVLGTIDHASAFARTTLEIDRRMNTQFLLGSDDGLQVWVNGKQVFKDLGTRGWKPEQFRTSVTLQEGKNEIVCRIEEETGSWQFSLEYIPSSPDVFRNRVKNVQETNKDP